METKNNNNDLKKGILWHGAMALAGVAALGSVELKNSLNPVYENSVENIIYGAVVTDKEIDEDANIFERYKTTMMKYDGGKFTVMERGDLYSYLEKGSIVSLQVQEVSKVKKDADGNVLEKKLEYAFVKNVIPAGSPNYGY